MAESYTGTCAPLSATMSLCASRVDSLRTECTKSYGTLTQWPGPCECSYYAQDLPCFDEQALCADQAWTQVPQWFRDGVTSCIMKDAAYTIRAQLGTFENPFTVESIKGVLSGSTTPMAQPSSTSAGGPSSTGSSPAATSAAQLDDEGDGVSGGAVAGIVVGVIAILAVAILALIWTRRRKRRVRASPAQEEHRKAELPGQSVEKKIAWSEPMELSTSQSILEISGSAKYEIGTPEIRHELPGCEPKLDSRDGSRETELCSGS